MNDSMKLMSDSVCSSNGAGVVKMLFLLARLIIGVVSDISAQNHVLSPRYESTVRVFDTTNNS